MTDHSKSMQQGLASKLVGLDTSNVEQNGLRPVLNYLYWNVANLCQTAKSCERIASDFETKWVTRWLVQCGRNL